MRVSLCIRQESKRNDDSVSVEELDWSAEREMMIQSVWKNLTGLQKEKWWFSQCGRTWLVCRKQLNTSGVTLNETKTHHQTPMTCTYGYRHIIHFKTVAAEVEIQCLSTWIMFLSCWHSLEVPFSLLKKGCQYLCLYNECKVIGVWWWVFGSFKVTPEVFSWD